MVLHVHWPFPHGLMAWLPAWLHGVKVVSSCHSAEIALAAQSKWSTRLLASCLRRSDAVTANSSHTARLIHAVSGRDAEVIPYGATVRIEEQAATGKPADVPLLLFSGRLIQRKGVNFLLRAMPLILARRKVRLVITGDGHYRDPWEALGRELGVHDAVEFAGYVSKERLGELFRACTLYVHPAIYDDRGDTEGLGVVLIEALRNRKPVVASRVGGIVDVIKDGETGLLVPEKNPTALAQAVLRLLDDPALARRLGEQGYLYASEFFRLGSDHRPAGSGLPARLPLNLAALDGRRRNRGEAGMRAARKSGLESRTLSTLGVLLAPGAAVGCVALKLLPRAGQLKGGLDRLRLEGFAAPLLARRDFPIPEGKADP
jgi:glycosyltransferase involved in cell wall biosynthesis